jgi:hypothetical protein
MHGKVTSPYISPILDATPSPLILIIFHTFGYHTDS